MEDILRKPFQGVKNIVHFNWHFYLLAFAAVLIILVAIFLFQALWLPGIIIIFLILASAIISLSVSSYVYDFSDLYKFSWLKDFGVEKEVILNINAGFDETSELIKSMFKDCDLSVADFYNPEKHTEISIKRARKKYTAFPGTVQVSTDALPFPDASADKILSIFSAHEIRNSEERILFFKELNRIVKPSGRIYITEHLRDSANFLAYNIGFFHFHSRSAWLNTFTMSGLIISKELKITPFVTTFILEKHGPTS